MHKPDWTKLTIPQLTRYAEHLVKMEFMTSGFEVFVSDHENRATTMVVKNENQKFTEILVVLTNLEKTNYAFIPKYVWKNKLPENLYVALVAFINEVQPLVYLIPTKVWEKPNDLFLDTSNPSRNTPEWGINMVKQNIQELSKYAYDHVIKELG